MAGRASHPYSTASDSIFTPGVYGRVVETDMGTGETWNNALFAEKHETHGLLERMNWGIARIDAGIQALTILDICIHGLVESSHLAGELARLQSVLPSHTLGGQK